MSTASDAGVSDADLLADLPVLTGHGAGNDFVLLVDPEDRAVGLSPDTVRRLCDRHRGVGGDGLIRVGGVRPGSLGDVDVTGAQVTMDYRNGDGSLAEMCGNGIRVTARVALEHGLVDPVRRLHVATRAGVRAVDVDLHDGTFVAATVDMGPSSTDPAGMGLDPAAIDGPVHGFSLRGLARPDGQDDVADLRWAGVSMGNPHVVGVVDDLDAIDLARLGPAVQAHPAFTDGVNVNLTEVVNDHHVRLRTWERGVGATLACGSGTCATVAVLAASGAVEVDATPVRVEVDGGDLAVAIDDRGHLLMTGPATIVARVDLDPRWLADLGVRSGCA